MEKVPPQEFESWFWHTPCGLRAAFWTPGDRSITIHLGGRGEFSFRKRKNKGLKRKCPHRNSNPGFGLERAASWATRRWGQFRQ